MRRYKNNFDGREDEQADFSWNAYPSQVVQAEHVRTKEIYAIKIIKKQMFNEDEVDVRDHFVVI